MWLDWSAPIFSVLLDSSSLRILALAIIVAGVLATFRVRSSALRHRAWTGVLLAMLLMPVLVRSVPRVTIPHPAAPSQSDDEKAEVVTFEVVAAGSMPVLGTTTTKGQMSPTDAEVSLTPGDLPRTSFWPTLLLAVYGIGVVVLLTRQVLGWIAMARLTRSQCTNAAALGPDVFESSAIVTPLVCGIFRSRIILPATWREWAPEKLAAALEHEREHIRRRDSLIGLAARLNCALFWFHPVAWWLDRKLAVLAEHACDDAVVSRLGEPRKYASTLLEIAAAVHGSGGRVFWQSVGMAGRRTLQLRIDRLLRVDTIRNDSLRRRAVVLFLCLGSIYLVAACQQQPADSDEIAKLHEELAGLRSEIRSLVAVDSVRPATADPNSRNLLEIAELREEIAGLRSEIRRLGVVASVRSATMDPKSRNPFHVPDIANPDGEDVRAFAKTVDYLGKSDDANAKQWVAIVTPGNRKSIDGEWIGRWNRGLGRWVPEYKAEVKSVGDRVYILYRDFQGRFLADLHREGDLLIGRLVGIDNPSDQSVCVVRIVGPDRLDGAYLDGPGGKGRLDFRRKLP